MALTYEAGDLCVYCGKDTSFGSGRFVNRVAATVGMEDSFLAPEPEAADFRIVEGYACPECFENECDECGEPIGLDEDYMAAGCIYHYECLTPELMAVHAAEYALNQEEAEAMIAEHHKTVVGLTST